MTTKSYLFDNDWSEQRARFDAVEAFLDPGSIRALEQTGAGPGWRCLEIGAGGGSIAAHLATRVGATGRVVATDIDTRHLDHLAGHGNIEVRAHDVVRDALEEGAFDLVHARLVLEHLPERERVLEKLARALRPGGWLVIEAVDYVSAIPVSDIGALEHAHTQAVRLALFEASGARTDHGRQLPGAFRRVGLVDVGNDGRVCVMRGGSPGARWFELSMAQLRPRLVGTGKVTNEEIDRMLALFADPEWEAFSPIILTCWGRAPR